MIIKLMVGEQSRCAQLSAAAVIPLVERRERACGPFANILDARISNAARPKYRLLSGAKLSSATR